VKVPLSFTVKIRTATPPSRCEACTITAPAVTEEGMKVQWDLGKTKERITAVLVVDRREPITLWSDPSNAASPLEEHSKIFSGSSLQV